MAAWVDALHLSRVQFLLLGCLLDVSVLLLEMTLFPQIVLWLPQTMGYGVK